MNELRKLQLVQTEILDVIVEICSKNDINYYLIGGTLLGAVRHEGFIPWDDDLDIAMSRLDFEKFINLCASELNDKYYLHWITTDNTYWLPFAKIRKKNTLLDEYTISHLNIPKEIFVDIFPLDNVIQEKSKTQKIKTNIIKSISKIIYIKKKIKLNSISDKNMLINIIRIIAALFPIKFLFKIQIKFMKSENHKSSAIYYINYGSNYDTIKQTILKSKYDPFKTAKFEEGIYKIPNDYDYILTRIYGDYMKLPPEEERTLRHKPQKISFGSENLEVNHETL